MPLDAIRSLRGVTCARYPVPALTHPYATAPVAYHRRSSNFTNPQSVMSDSERPQPDEATITSKLRDIVIAIHKSGKTDDLTVKRVRARAENELGLDEGFFKTDATWKAKSQETIVDAVVGSSNEYDNYFQYLRNA